MHHADAVRVGETDGSAQQARLPDPLEAGQLAVAIEAMASGKQRLTPDIALVGHDDGDTGSHRAFTNPEWSVAIDQGRMADPDPGDVADRIERPG